VIYSFDAKAGFLESLLCLITVFSVTQSFRNHSNMLICCSRNVSYYYPCFKQLYYGFHKT